MLEFHRPLGANPPAIPAPGTARHVVKKFSLVPIIFVGEGACRTILDTGQATITSFVDTEVCHDFVSLPSPQATCNLIAWNILDADSIIRA
jgi:hypothetical protein